MWMMRRLLRAHRDDELIARVKNIFFEEGPEPKHPELALVLGQQGAGKSTLLAQIYDTFPNSEAKACLDYDKLREFHPSYTAISRNPFDMAIRTTSFGSSVVARLLIDALEDRKNIVVECAIPNKLHWAILVKQSSVCGYRNHVHFLPIHWRDSFLSVVQRFEGTLEKTGTARWVSAQGQKAAYMRTLPCLRAIEQSGVWSSLSVHQRGKLPVRVDKGQRCSWSPSEIFLTCQSEAWPVQRSFAHAEATQGLLQKVCLRKEHSPLWYRAMLYEFARQSERIVAGNKENLKVSAMEPLCQIERQFRFHGLSVAAFKRAVRQRSYP
ncbi:MAG: zeta toxin family protein [Alphaproteobacteria bacterium]|nr:zeta toxin family protein [Alphaproteobacteria bacterium]